MVKVKYKTELTGKGRATLALQNCLQRIVSGKCMQLSKTKRG